MTIKTTLAALVFAALPGWAAAQCIGAEHAKTTAMTCADGYVIDAETGTCVEVTSS